MTSDRIFGLETLYFHPARMLSGFPPSSSKETLSFSRYLMALGWGNIVKQYCTVPLLILMCLTVPSIAQRYTIGIPNSCSTNETTALQQLPGWEYRGCYVDQSTPRLLQNNSVGLENMTVTLCASICSSRGYAYFGLEFSFECWCGSTLNPTVVPVDSSNCNYACCADGSVACGGFWFIGVYAANAANNSGVAPTQTPSATNNSGNNSNNATNHGSNDSQTSKNIALGTGIGISVLGVILSAILVIMKRSKWGHNPKQNELSSTRSLYEVAGHNYKQNELSSARSLYEVAGHNPEQNASQQSSEMSTTRSLYEVAGHNPEQNASQQWSEAFSIRSLYAEPASPI